MKTYTVVRIDAEGRHVLGVKTTAELADLVRVGERVDFTSDDRLQRWRFPLRFTDPQTCETRIVPDAYTHSIEAIEIRGHHPVNRPRSEKVRRALDVLFAAHGYTPAAQRRADRMTQTVKNRDHELERQRKRIVQLEASLAAAAEREPAPAFVWLVTGDCTPRVFKFLDAARKHVESLRPGLAVSHGEDAWTYYDATTQITIRKAALT